MVILLTPRIMTGREVLSDEMLGLAGITADMFKQKVEAAEEEAREGGGE